MRVKLILDTVSDVQEFVNIASDITETVNLEDDEGHVVSGKSLLGCLYSLEFRELYCTCEKDISCKLLKFIK